METRILGRTAHPSTVGTFGGVLKVLDAAERFKPLSLEEQEAVLAQQCPLLPHPELAIPAAA